MHNTDKLSPDYFFWSVILHEEIENLREFSDNKIEERAHRIIFPKN